MEKNNAAKFAFFYMLSLVALLFMSLSTGMIIFQIINKHILDVINQYSGTYSSDQLKFAISALIISVPVFYLTSGQIYKSLFSGELEKESGIRKWLTYFILLVSSVVMIGWMIATINSFLDGELTTKFILKAITAIGIAASIFTFYFFDIKREEVKEKKSKMIQGYFYGSLILVLVVFVAGIFIVESPTQTRNRKIDNAALDGFNEIDRAINEYYYENNKMPQSLDELVSEYTYITEKELQNPLDGKKYIYNIRAAREYELCTNFLSSNKDSLDEMYSYYKDRWPHDAGEQCLKQKVTEQKIKVEPTNPTESVVTPESKSETVPAQ